MKSGMVGMARLGQCGAPTITPAPPGEAAAMRFDVRHNIAEVERGLSNFAREQIPFATSKAINAVAEEVAREEERHLRARLDRPTPYTLRGLGVLRSSKRKLEAAVFIKDRQATYLVFQERGGVRKPKARAIPVPVKVRLNRFGNMPKGGVKRLAAMPNTFSGKPRGGGAPGLYKRLGVSADSKGGRGLQLQVTWASGARYRPSIAFLETARRIAMRRAGPEFERALTEAIATARR